MVKAVVFDMFETLVTLFRGRTYFGEDSTAPRARPGSWTSAAGTEQSAGGSPPARIFLRSGGAPYGYV